MLAVQGRRSLFRGLVQFAPRKAVALAVGLGVDSLSLECTLQPTSKNQTELQMKKIFILIAILGMFGISDVLTGTIQYIEEDNFLQLMSKSQETMELLGTLFK